MMTRLFPLLVALALSGCVDLAQKAMLDGQTAQAAAVAVGLPDDALCWASYVALAKVFVAPAGSAAPVVGIAATIETKRALQHLLGSPACLPITTQLLGEALKFSSPQGAGLATILGF
jgi:hypothetical protein